MAERVAFLGLGIMGSRMAASLRRAGYEVAAWNRTSKTAADWASQHGATACPSPAAAAQDAAAIVSMVVNGEQVHELLLGPDGAVGSAPEGVLCIDCSTIAPHDARRIGAEVRGRGGAFIDAPVSGSSPKAEDGTLTIMAGGDAGDIERARPFLAAMGDVIVHVGPLGEGQVVKLVNNAVAAANAAVLAQALMVAKATGADLSKLVEVMAAGSAGSAMLGLKAGPMQAHDYTPLFKLDHMLKDVGLCLQAAHEAGVSFPAAAETYELMVAAAARGHGDDDFCAVLEAVEGLAGRRI